MVTVSTTSCVRARSGADSHTKLMQVTRPARTEQDQRRADETWPDRRRRAAQAIPTAQTSAKARLRSLAGKPNGEAPAHKAVPGPRPPPPPTAAAVAEDASYRGCPPAIWLAAKTERRAPVENALAIGAAQHGRTVDPAEQVGAQHEVHGDTPAERDDAHQELGREAMPGGEAICGRRGASTARTAASRADRPSPMGDADDKAHQNENFGRQPHQERGFVRCAR